MLKYIQEYDCNVGITSFKNVRIEDWKEFLSTIENGKEKGVEVQFFDADYVATWEHLYFAVLNALMAFEDGMNISKSLSIETILYFSGQHQIVKALKMFGVKPSSTRIAMVAIGKNVGAVKSTVALASKCLAVEADDSVLKLSKSKLISLKRAFDISEVEVETVAKKNDYGKTLVDLVIERMALLATEH